MSVHEIEWRFGIRSWRARSWKWRASKAPEDLWHRVKLDGDNRMRLHPTIIRVIGPTRRTSILRLSSLYNCENAVKSVPSFKFTLSFSFCNFVQLYVYVITAIEVLIIWQCFSELLKKCLSINYLQNFIHFNSDK